MYGLFVERLGGNVSLTGNSAALFLAAFSVTAMLSGRIADKLGSRRLIIVSYLVFTGPFLSHLFVHSLATLFIVRAIYGVSLGVFVPAFSSIYSRNLKTGRYTTAWEYIFAMATLAQALSAFTGGFLVTKFGFTGLFLARAILAGVGFLLSLAMLPSDRDT